MSNCQYSKQSVFLFFLTIQFTLIRLVDQGLLQSMKKAPN